MSAFEIIRGRNDREPRSMWQISDNRGSVRDRAPLTGTAIRPRNGSIGILI